MNIVEVEGVSAVILMYLPSVALFTFSLTSPSGLQ